MTQNGLGKRKKKEEEEKIRRRGGGRKVGRERRRGEKEEKKGKGTWEFIAKVCCLRLSIGIKCFESPTDVTRI